MTRVKHITSTCPIKGCLHEAFVQVLVVEDAKIQKRIDAKANIKLTKELKRLHQEGAHD